MGNCDVWGYADFGNGAVKIRCTQTGVHEIHCCVVNIQPDQFREVTSETAEHHNVFDG